MMSLLNLCFASAWLVFQFNCHPFWQCGLVFSLPTSIKYNSPFVFFQTHICLWDNAVHHCHEEFLPVKSFSFHISHTWRLFWTLQIDVMYCHCFLFSLIPPSLSPYLSRACFLCVLTLRHFSCHVFMSFFFFCHVISGSGINHAAQSLQWSLLVSWSSSKNADLQNSVLFVSVFHLILTSLL